MLIIGGDNIIGGEGEQNNKCFGAKNPFLQ